VDALLCQNQPSLDRPTMALAFPGWTDAQLEVLR
jgi:hypothetical protein